MNFEGKGKVGQAEKSWPSEINGKGQNVYLRQFVIYCFIEKIKSPPSLPPPPGSLVQTLGPSGSEHLGWEIQACRVCPRPGVRVLGQCVTTSPEPARPVG